MNDLVFTPGFEVFYYDVNNTRKQLEEQLEVEQEENRYKECINDSNVIQYIRSCKREKSQYRHHWKSLVDEFKYSFDFEINSSSIVEEYIRKHYALYICDSPDKVIAYNDWRFGILMADVLYVLKQRFDVDMEEIYFDCNFMRMTYIIRGLRDDKMYNLKYDNPKQIANYIINYLPDFFMTI